MTTCPSCGYARADGAFCERCGAALPAAVSAPAPAPAAAEADDDQSATLEMKPVARPLRRMATSAVPGWDDHSLAAAERRIEREVSDETLLRVQRGEPTLDYDHSCPLFENMNGILRFRFNPLGGGERVENVTISFTNPDCAKSPVQRIRHADREQEVLVQFPPQATGVQSWDVKVEYYSTRRKHELAGQLQVFVRPVESRKRGSDNFNISIGGVNVGPVGNASDVTVNQRGVEDLAKLVAASDPFEEMSRIVSSDVRDWRPIDLSDDSEVVSLPPQPSNARTDRIVLDFGTERMHFFAARTIQFGRTREMNDFVLRPGRPVKDCTPAELIPYKTVSHRQCFFEHVGANVAVSDGWRDERGVVQPSSNGTFWNDDPMRGPAELPMGKTGVVSFAGPHCAGCLSLEAKACAPSRACKTCPHSNIHWCGEGRRPSLMLSRCDGVPEKFVGLWSCFCLGDADPSYEGMVIFRKDGAFAYRDGSRSGWLVPGTVVPTDMGPVRVLESITSTF